MKAIILAAGIGSRLRPITNEKPKTLVEVNGKPLLGHILDSLIVNGIKDIVICVGYKSEEIINYCESTYTTINFKFIDNKDFDKTNNMYSLFLAKEELNDDLILMNADLVFDSNIISGLIKEETSAVAVDVGTYIEESMKVTVDNEFISSISKKISESDSKGCSIDIYKLNKSDLSIILSELNRIIIKNKDLNQWTELMLDNLFKSKQLLTKVMDIKNSFWFEIGNFDDLAKAEILFNNEIKKLGSKKIFFIDRDGTLTLGNKLITGSNDFLNELKNKNKLFYVLTNNSSRTPKEHFNKFSNLNLNLSEDNVLVSIQSALLF